MDNATILAVVLAIASGLNLFIGLRISVEIGRLRTEIEKGRAEDKDEMREWINGCFLRAKEARAELRGLDLRLSRIEAAIK